jgi:hypothetical protein
MSKRLHLFMAAAGLAAAAIAAPAVAKPPRPVPALVLFDRANFTGYSVVLTRDAPRLAPFRFDDKAQSAVVRGGGRWLLCEHPEYRGRCIMLSANDPNLRRVGLANQVSSVRRVR